MALNAQRFAIIDIPQASAALLDSYDRCPLDEYMGNQTRYKRFSQYRLTPNKDTGVWGFDKLEHRDYTAFKEFNPIGGGIKRKHPPLEADWFTDYVRLGIAGMELDDSEDWQINVHQNRTVATPEKPGLLTPEGIHRDGHEFVMIGILRRNNVIGGETRLWTGPEDKEPFWTGTLQPGQAVLLDDRNVWHDVTDVLPEDGTRGNRDIFIASFSRWREKWYGDEHDAAVMAAAGEGASSM